MSFSHSLGAGLPGIKAVVITMSTSFGLLAEQGVLGVKKRLRHFFRVPAGALARLFDM